jgi:hypothetical protein
MEYLNSTTITTPTDGKNSSMWIIAGIGIGILALAVGLTFTTKYLLKKYGYYSKKHDDIKKQDGIEKNNKNDVAIPIQKEEMDEDEVETERDREIKEKLTKRDKIILDKFAEFDKQNEEQDKINKKHDEWLEQRGQKLDALKEQVKEAGKLVTILNITADYSCRVIQTAYDSVKDYPQEMQAARAILDESTAVTNLITEQVMENAARINEANQYSLDRINNTIDYDSEGKKVMNNGVQKP